MTRPLPPGAPRQRKEKACLPCRNAKCKCVTSASPSTSATEDKCARCERLGITCVFAPSGRMGRPRRIVSDHTLSNKAREAADIPAFATGVEGKMDIFIDGHSSSDMKVHHYEDEPHTAPESSEPAHHQSPYTNLAEEYLRSTHPFMPVLPATLPQLLGTLEAASPALISAVSSISSFTATEAKEEISTENSYSPLDGIRAAALMTHAYYGRGEVDKAREAVQVASNRLIELNVHIMDRHFIAGHHYPENMADNNANISAKASPVESSSSASMSAGEESGNRQSWWSSPGSSSSSVTSASSPPSVTVCMPHSRPNSAVDEASTNGCHGDENDTECENWRSLFWEIFVLEIMLAAATGVRSHFRLALLERYSGDSNGYHNASGDGVCWVLFPGERTWRYPYHGGYQTNVGGGEEFMSPLKMKVQAFELLRSCTTPPSPNLPSAPPMSVDMPDSEEERMQNLAARANHLAKRTREMWTSCSTRLQAVPQNLGTTSHEPENYHDHDPLRAEMLANAEAALLATLVASASVIYLHGSAGLLSQFFACGVDITSQLRPAPAPVTTSVDGYPICSRTSSGAFGVDEEGDWACVREASETIWSVLGEVEWLENTARGDGEGGDVNMDVIPAEQEAMDSSTPHSPLGPGTSHSPFFGCAMLVAAHGSVMLLERDLDAAKPSSMGTYQDHEREEKLKHSAADLNTRLQLASRILRVLGKRWASAWKMAEEVDRVGERAGLACWVSRNR